MNSNLPIPLCSHSTGHQGRHGHEFLEFEYSRGRLRYANNSNYRNDSLIRKESEPFTPIFPPCPPETFSLVAFRAGDTDDLQSLSFLDDGVGAKR